MRFAKCFLDQLVIREVSSLMNEFTKPLGDSLTMLQRHRISREFPRENHRYLTWTFSSEFHFYCKLISRSIFHVSFTCGDFACVQRIRSTISTPIKNFEEHDSISVLRRVDISSTDHYLLMTSLRLLHKKAMRTTKLERMKLRKTLGRINRITLTQSGQTNQKSSASKGRLKEHAGTSPTISSRQG